MFPRYLLENKSDHLRAELRRAPLSKRVAVGSLKEGHVVFEQQKAPEKKKKNTNNQRLEPPKNWMVLEFGSMFFFEIPGGLF